MWSFWWVASFCIAMVIAGACWEQWRLRTGKMRGRPTSWLAIAGLCVVLVGSFVIWRMAELDKEYRAERRAKAWASFMESAQ